MKNFLGKKITFTKFLVSVFVLFIILFLVNLGKFVWSNQTVSRQEIKILTQNNFSSGGSGNIQIYASEILDNQKIENAKVFLDLIQDKNDKVTELFSGELNNGFMAANFVLPNLEPGEYKIRTIISSKYGKDEIEKIIQITKEPRITISTDRTLYKPGHTMNFRVLAMDSSTLVPISEKDILVSVKDPKGNKLFQKSFQSSEYGIISGSFDFSEELVFGDYTLIASTEGQEVEKVVEVKQFTLPKFEVSVLPDQDLSNIGDELSGKVLAKYFFGKPLIGAKAQISLNIGSHHYSTSGTTNENGFASFTFYNLNNIQNGEVSIYAEVVDENNNVVIGQIGAKISEEDINIELIPESKKLKPGIDNEILFIASRSDGTPVEANVSLTGERLREFRTNAYGIAKFTYRPDEGASDSTFKLSVRDDQGNFVQKSFTLENENNNNGYVLLKTNKTLYQDDNKVEIETLSTNNVLTHIEFIQNDRVVYSDALSINEGKGEKTIEIPEDLFGTIEVRALQIVETKKVSNLRYAFQYNNNRSEFSFVIDSKIIFVDRPKNLNIDISLDKETYLPGSEAKVSFSVSDKNSNKENSAIGVKVVDEALLALQSDDDTLSKLLFLVDDNIKDNASDINGLNWESVIDNDSIVIKDNILQAMFLNAPRAKVSFSKIEKNNYQNWYNYQREKKRVGSSIILLALILSLIFVFRFWWQLTAITHELGVTFKIWGTSVIVSLSSLLAIAMFFSDRRISRAIENVIGNLTEDVFLEFVNSDYYLYWLGVIIITFIGLAWVYRNVIFNKFKNVIISFFVLSGLLTFFAVMEKFDMGISAVYDKDLWGLFANLIVATLVIGLLVFFIIRHAKNSKFTGWTWLNITLIGILSWMFLPAVVIFSLAIFLFWVVRSGGSDIGDISDELDLHNDLLLSKGTSEEKTKLEILLLRRELERKKMFSSIGRAIAVLGVITIFIFFGFAIVTWTVSTSQGLIIEGSIDNTYRSSRSPLLENTGSFSSTMPSSGGLNLGTEYAGNLGLSDGGGQTPSGLFDVFKSSSKSDDFDSYQAKEESMELIESDTTEPEESFKKADRVRKFFPETMFWNAELIAENGLAEIFIPIKDSITKWKMSALANSLSGKIGSASKNMITFQDFFIDFDIPLNLTRGDELIIPVSVFNYLEESQRIRLVIREDNWFTLETPNNLILNLQPNQTEIVNLKLKIERYGDYVLRIDADGTKMSDAVEKVVAISPYGKRITQTVASEKLNQDILDLQAIFPKNAILGTKSVSVMVYPTVFSEIVEGIEKILRFPSGCFEQTSSALYPDILVLKYLKKSGQEASEITAKAENMINKGMQKLLTYEISGGGFSLYGRGQAETVLTAYGLMEFNEMKDVAFVDENLINRTKDWLFRQQNSNGSFKLAGSHNGGLTDYSVVGKNAYITWALSEAYPDDPRIARSISYLENNMTQIEQDSYLLALTANAFINVDSNSKIAKETLRKLKQEVEQDESKGYYIKMKRKNHYGSYGNSGNIEVTALSLMAFAKAGELDFAQQLNKYIIASKDGRGTWGSTQSTILALKALVENEIANQVVKNNKGDIKVTFNQNESKEITITPENSEVVQSFRFENNVGSQNYIDIEKDGKIDASIQVIKEYYEEWDASATPMAYNNTSGLAVSFGFTNPGSLMHNYVPRLIQGSLATMYVGVSTRQNIQNAVVEIPIPAGFEIEPDSLTAQLSSINNNANSALSKFEIKNGSIILYFNSLNPGMMKTVKIQFYPRTIGKFKVMPARLYNYYDQYDEAYSVPVGEIEVIRVN